MGAGTPIICPTGSYEMLCGQLPTIESTESLMAGAVSIAAVVQASPAELAAGSGGNLEALNNLAEAVDQRIDLLADDARNSLKSTGGAGPLTKDRVGRLAAVLDVLFAHEAFCGATDEYDHPRYSDLAYVLHSKRGLPITLSLVVTAVARKLSVPMVGIGLPGHFLVGMVPHGSPQPEVPLVDAFAGGAIVSAETARKRVELTFGPGAFQPRHLQPVSHRQWLSRMLQNLLHSFERRGLYHHVAATVELQRVLWPEELHLTRDLGLVLARLGRRQDCIMLLEQYLAESPDDPQFEQLRQLLNRLAA